MSIAEAQANYIVYGAVLPEMVEHTRPPLPEMGKDPAWEPYPEAIQLAKRIQQQGDMHGE